MIITIDEKTRADANVGTVQAHFQEPYCESRGVTVWHSMMPRATVAATANMIQRGLLIVMNKDAKAIPIKMPSRR